KDVEVIELLVSAGDKVEKEQSLITVESDKASMEVPSTHAGTIKSLKVKLGDKVSEGSVILELEASEDAQAPAAKAEAPAKAEEKPATEEKKPEQPKAEEPKQSAPSKAASTESASSAPVGRHAPTEALTNADGSARKLPHASPSVRKFARELGVD